MQDKDEQLLKKRISELAALCYQRDIRSYTDFLTLNEQTIFHSMKRTLPPVTWLMGGGYETAERKIVCFLPSYEDETADLPISILEALCRGSDTPGFSGGHYEPWNIAKLYWRYSDE